MLRFIERLNTLLAVAVVLVLFLVIDGLLFYRYELRLQESRTSGSLLATPESTEKAKTHSVTIAVEDAPSWLVVENDGETVLAQESQPGFSRTFEVNRELNVYAEDAGAVSTQVDGKNIGRLGGSGESWNWTFAV